MPGWDYVCHFDLGDTPDPYDQSDAGIFAAITTDSVRFSSSGADVDLQEVPLLLFTEAMRDIGLFVGVTSIGADVEWRDWGDARTYNERI